MWLTTIVPSGRPMAPGSCFARTGPGSSDLYQKLTSGAGAEERLVVSSQQKTPTSWSADGRFLLYHSVDPQTDADLWVVPMVGDRTPSVFLKTPFREWLGAFSPDGRWVAYQSNESGRSEIYVRPFVPPGAAGTAAGAAGGQWQVSTAGGIYPVWRPDGKELYYLNPAGAMMAAPITVAGSTLEPGAPVVLFPTRIVGGGVDAATGSAVRRRPRRALPHQHGTGQRRRADHAAAELESRGEEVALARRIGPPWSLALIGSADSEPVRPDCRLRRCREPVANDVVTSRRSVCRALTSSSPRISGVDLRCRRNPVVHEERV